MFPGQPVTVLNRGANGEEALTDQDGTWRTTIVTPPAGGPFTLEVRGKNVVIVLSGGNVDAELFARLVA